MRKDKILWTNPKKPTQHYAAFFGLLVFLVYAMSIMAVALKNYGPEPVSMKILC
jgi:hypothetical protein